MDIKTLKKAKRNFLSLFVIFILFGFVSLWVNACMPDYDPNHEYVGSKNSNKFHVKTCHHAKRIRPGNLVSWATYEDAINAGRTPCGVCKATPQAHKTQPVTKTKDYRQSKPDAKKSEYDPNHPYVGSRKSEIFHKKTCHHVRRIKPENLVSWATYEEAVKDGRGRRACRTCKPSKNQI